MPYIYIYAYMYVCMYIYISSLKKRRLNACIQLKFHAICYLNHQVYYLYYALKITKIYVKNNTSNNTLSNEIELQKNTKDI